MNLILHLILVLALCRDLVLAGLVGNTRIIGGTKATDNYPFMVSLQAKSSYGYNSEVANRGWSHYCGGSIVSIRHVLTAAHCVSAVDVLMKDFSIFAGSHKLNGNGTRYYIESILVHPGFVNLRRNDLAIIKTKETIECVPNKIESIFFSDKVIGDGVSCTVMGWGYINQNRFGASNDLLELNVPTISNEDCRQTGLYSVGETEMCTFSKRKEGFCGGDSGGPLITDNLLVGVVSFNTARCAIGIPDVYERVSYNYNWIKNNTDPCV